MKKDLAEALFAVAPHWFVRDDPQRSSMCFGFEFGDGWFPLVRDLFVSIRPLAGPQFHIVQVKEKYGRLQVEAFGSNADIQALIWAAEKKSFETCEWCGQPGRPETFRGYVLTLCLACGELRAAQGHSRRPASERSGHDG